MKSKFYVTTPIYYVNDRPHVGHAYTTIVADVLARLRRISGEDVTFLTGTDENSQKTVDAAMKSGEEIGAYTDRLAEIWKKTWQALKITNTDFIRTTEPRHRKVVEEIWKRIEEKGDIYKGKYEGLYCVGHESFMKEGDLVDGYCPDHKTKPEHLVEENYFFKLSNYQKDLLKFYAENPAFVVPEGRFNEVKSFVESGLEDLSISRETQKWGIQVPSDPKQVIYVWFDALINYVSGVGVKEWEEHPADIHTVGKDITRFHAVIWPAMLMSAGLPLPRQVAANGFFTVNGVKISKSLGNAIDPVELAKTYGSDALRYFLLREIPYGEDGDFSEAKLKERYNADLANGLGNLVQRVATLIENNLNGELIFKKELLANARKTLADVLDTKNYDRAMNEFRLHDALAQLWAVVGAANRYVNDQQPWALAKSDPAKFLEVMTVAMGLIRHIIWFLQPFMPETSRKIFEVFGDDGGKEIPENYRFKIKRGAGLFPRRSP